MIAAIRARRDAWILTLDLCRSLSDVDARWKIEGEGDMITILSRGDFRIELVPRRVRLFDAVHLLRDGAEIWLPPLPRLRLRAAARLRLLELAKEAGSKLFDTPEPLRSRKSRATA
jgi:hypothetical protein